MSDQPDKSKWLWCHNCKREKPPEGREGFRCSDCAARGKNNPLRWKFDAAGNVISKGTKPKTKKAGAATPASNATKGASND